MVFDLFLCLLKGRIRLPIKTQELPVKCDLMTPLTNGRASREAGDNGSP